MALEKRRPAASAKANGPGFGKAGELKPISFYVWRAFAAIAEARS